MTKKHKLDIFDTLAAIDKKDRDFLDRQSEADKKGFFPTMVLRWSSAVSGPNSEHYLLAANEFANISFYDLYDYPDLQYRLLTVVGAGKPQRHEWIPVSKNSGSATKLQSFVARYYPLASSQEIDLLINLHTEQSFEDFVNQGGCAPDEAKEIISAFKKAHK